MNRVERKNITRNEVKKKVTYTYTLEQLNKLLDDKVEEQNKIYSQVTSKIMNEKLRDAKIEISQRVTNVTLGIVIGVLHNDFKFGKKRLDRMFDEVRSQIKAFNEKRLSLDEIIKVVNDIGVEDVVSKDSTGGEIIDRPNNI